MQIIVNQRLIENAFRDDVNLKNRVFDAISSTPQHVQLFEDLARHFEKLRDGASRGDGEPSAKRRKLENGDDVGDICLPEGNGVTINLETQQDQKWDLVFQANDLSFQIPLRKKLHLQIGQYSPHGSNTGFKGLRLKSTSTDEVEYEMVVDQIEHILKLPVPEKAQKQWNYIILPASTISTLEPILFTINDNAKFQTRNDDPNSNNDVLPSHSQLENALSCMTASREFGISQPDAVEFSSAIPESHRKKDTAYHVKAFRGSKDGFLFFLHSMIFFGFKKPLLYFSLDTIKSVSYTSVLQRTFNMVIAYEEGEEEREIEFSMLDQADFAGIDAYVKRHGLADASLAEARKAKKLGINKKRKDGEIDVEREEEQSELKRAEQAMEEQEVDEEDELEEDYDPGSEGESEGSGSESGEEGDGAGDEGGVDLVREELGSEAEEIDDEEAEDGDEEELEEVEDVEKEGTEEVNEEQAEEVGKQALDVEGDDQL